jgi:hypothetical protein
MQDSRPRRSSPIPSRHEDGENTSEDDVFSIALAYLAHHLDARAGGMRPKGVVVDGEERIIRAIEDAGPRPNLHSHQLARLREEWPVLVAALAQFLQEHERPVPEEWRR